MRVTLVQPDTGGSYPPLSLGYLAAYVAARGHEARILDLQVPAQQARWEQLLVESRPDLIGFTALTPSIRGAGELAARARELVPTAKLIVGGFHASMEPEQTLRDYPAFDYLCIGEGEETLAELCERLDAGRSPEGVAGLVWRRDCGLGIADCGLKSEIGNRKSEIEFGPPRGRILDLDALPRPHAFYDLDYYLEAGSFTYQYGYRCASVIASRGCPFRCRFCSIPGKYVHQSPERLADEIGELLARGADGVFFRDSTFTINRDWVLAFCDVVRQRRMQFHWIANARPDLVDAELLAAMKRAGCFALCYGVESGRDHVLDYYGKDHTVADTRRAVAATKRAGIRVVAYLMLGAPIETRADIEASVALARGLGAERTIWKIFAPLPGCEIYNELKAKGVKLDFDAIRTDRASYPLADMTEAEIEGRFRELQREFAYARDSRLRVFWRQLRRVRSPRDAWRLARRVCSSAFTRSSQKPPEGRTTNAGRSGGD
ncbi:MAG: B12-binding domain-containing radical SAM protein [Planctomycetes bacterium]|nr:B12-binding domain-containing radical SAM protein [Planctomycetota bacterium]